MLFYSMHTKVVGGGCHALTKPFRVLFPSSTLVCVWKDSLIRSMYASHEQIKVFVILGQQ